MQEEYKLPLRLDSQGRVTIPEAIRDEMGIKKGDRVLVKIEIVPRGSQSQRSR